jgi:cobalamin biosynthesis protein CobD/CbiB
MKAVQMRSMASKMPDASAAGAIHTTLVGCNTYNHELVRPIDPNLQLVHC